MADMVMKFLRLIAFPLFISERVSFQHLSTVRPSDNQGKLSRSRERRKTNEASLRVLSFFLLKCEPLKPDRKRSKEVSIPVLNFDADSPVLSLFEGMMTSSLSQTKLQPKPPSTFCHVASNFFARFVSTCLASVGLAASSALRCQSELALELDLQFRTRRSHKNRTT